MRSSNNLKKGKKHTTDLLKLLDLVGMTDEEKRKFIEDAKRKAEQKGTHQPEGN